MFYIILQILNVSVFLHRTYPHEESFPTFGSFFGISFIAQKKEHYSQKTKNGYQIRQDLSVLNLPDSNKNNPMEEEYIRFLQK